MYSVTLLVPGYVSLISFAQAQPLRRFPRGGLIGTFLPFQCVVNRDSGVLAKVRYP